MNAQAADKGVPRRKRSVVFWILVVIGSLLAVGFFFRVGQALYFRLRPSPDVEIPAVMVEVIELSPRSFEHTVPIAGTLSPVHSVDVFPKVGGKVVAMHVGLGDIVQAGERLATVESTEYSLQARQADVGLQMAEEAVGMAQRSFERLDRVRERSGSLGQLEQAFEEAELQLESARTQRELAGIQSDLAHQMVRNATMVAPVSGVISRVHASHGGMVGSEYPAFHIDTTDELVVRCEVGDLDLPRIAVGQPVRLWADALQDRTIQGTVTAVSPTLDSWTRRAPVEIVVPNPGADITGNLFARGEIVVATDPASLVLPQEVVHRTVDETWVQIVRDGVIREIAISIRSESHAQLSIDGLAEGDLVVVPGAEHLAEGEPVIPLPADGDQTSLIGIGPTQGPG